MTIDTTECEFDPLSAFSALVRDVAEAYADDSTNTPWIVAFSGGKDSTILADIVFQALLETPPNRRIRPIHIVSNDTLVESPLVMGHLRVVQSEIAEAARVLNLPITVVTTQPTVDQSFWVNLIGRGYPSPNRTMRWCTKFKDFADKQLRHRFSQ
jgi:DNA sulfur modification protein DndC